MPRRSTENDRRQRQAAARARSASRSRSAASQALRDVDFTLRAGEIHGLVGENGAGKSTLMKIIAGVHHDYDGTMRLDGREVRFRSARDALDAGIGMVHQELTIVPDLTVAENVFLGTQPVTRRRHRRLGAHGARGARASRRPRHRRRSARPASASLPIGLQQLIEIARVLFSGARIIILDEPTSALSPPEVERLFAMLRRAAATAAAASSSSRISSTTSCASPTR